MSLGTTIENLYEKDENKQKEIFYYSFWRKTRCPQN